MPDVELARRPGVELVRTGRFETLTGSWNPTPADIKAAVEAMECPAIRKPVIRLGHTDRRFVGDGEPALGWFENLRATDGGHTLVADQVTLPWLHSVQAAAYPSRSIEGNYNHRCSEGHVHPFVIHTVALLGVTPPGVQTLRSLNDLPDMLGVAASGEVPEGAEHVQVTILAAEPAPDGDGDDDDEPTGVMVALIPTAEDAARLAVDGGKPADQLHLTLAYLGDAADLDASARQDLIDTVSSVVNGMPVIDGTIFSVGVYNPGDTTDRDTCLVYQASGDLLNALHDAIDDALGDPDFSPEPWFAHVTAVYSDDLGRLPDLIGNVGPVTFDRVRIAIAGQTVDIPLLDYAAAGDLEGSADSLYADLPVMAAGAPGKGNPQALKSYWTKDPKGLAQWASTPHPWTALYHHLLKYLPDDEAKRTAAQWYHTVFGTWPGSKHGNKAAAHQKEAVMAAAVSDKPWDPQQSDYTPAQWKTACVIDTEVGSADAKSRYKLPVREPDGTLNKAGLLAAGKMFDSVKSISPATRKAAASSLLALFKQAGVDPPPALRFAAGAKVAASTPDLPAAEPEQPNTDPKEDPVSTELSGLRSRLGLDDTADLDAITAAVDELKAKADTPAVPDPEMVAASAAAVEQARAAEAEKDELRKEVQILASQMKTVSDELATAKAEKAATVKASVFEAAIKDGKIKPADREAWEKDYDEAPAAVTRVLASLAVGTAVPVAASGSIGSPEPDGSDAEFEALIARIDAPTGKAV